MAAIERVDPVSNFSFKIEIEGVVAGWFTTCSGLTVEREVTPHPEGGMNDYVHQLPGRIKRHSITLKRGIADNTLWSWFQEGVYDGKVKRRHVSIILYDSNRTELQRWDLTNAYPTKWTLSDPKTDNNQTVIETLELAAGGDTSPGGSNVAQRMPASAGSRSGSEEASPPEFDIHTLAQKVYNLLKQELRVERERLG